MIRIRVFFRGSDLVWFLSKVGSGWEKPTRIRNAAYTVTVKLDILIIRCSPERIQIRERVKQILLHLSTNIILLELQNTFDPDFQLQSAIIYDYIGPRCLQGKYHKLALVPPLSTGAILEVNSFFVRSRNTLTHTHMLRRKGLLKNLNCDCIRCKRMP